MGRNMLKCTLTGSERITNNSYLKKRLDALGVDEKFFRKHYASKEAVGWLRGDIARGELAQTAQKLGKPEDWLVQVALMNGKSKLFRKALSENVTSITTDTASVVPGELDKAGESAGSLV